MLVCAKGRSFMTRKLQALTAVSMAGPAVCCERLCRSIESDAACNRSLVTGRRWVKALIYVNSFMPLIKKISNLLHKKVDSPIVELVSVVGD